MPSTKRYSKSPIVEAIIDIQGEIPVVITGESLAAIGDDIKVSYPTRKDITQVAGTITAQGLTAAPQKLIGYRYDSSDGKYVLQARTNGFTLSRLAPYEYWDPFRDEAQRLWQLYKSVAKPLKLTRAAVRYINQVLLPGQAIDMKDYFTTYPEISAALPQLMAQFAMQVVLPVPESEGITLSLIQASLPIVDKNVLPINLDIDIYKATAAGFESDQEIWELLEQFREIRNSMFEGCITDKTRALFSPIAEVNT
jgi:uncharacterized protein (TIGR04255 family)